MKRLKLEDFKLKNLKEESTTSNQLLGQVLGDCHDGGCQAIPGTVSPNGIPITWIDIPTNAGAVQ